MNKTIKYKLILGLMLLLTALSPTGCITVGPDYTPPEIAEPGRWSADLDGKFSEAPVDFNQLAEWWTTLNDPILSRLIEQAIRDNLDLKEARARIREARARRGLSRAERFPTIDATGSAVSGRASENTGSGKRHELYAAGFDAGWEIDLFGGVQRSIEAAQADLEAHHEDLRHTLVSLLAEVALNYVEERTFQTRLGVAEANLKIRTKTYELTVFRFQAGLTTALDMEQATYNLEHTRSQIPALQNSIYEAKNRLVVLLGTQPGTLDKELSEHKPIPVVPLEIAVGVPAEVLRHRPDVRRAERELAAQTAQVGVATARLYPKFSLLGSIGLEALSLGDLFSTGNRSDSIGPRFSWNIFDAGAIRNNIEVQNALQEQALIRYEAAIIKALEEVTNSLTAYGYEQKRKQALVQATKAAQQAVDLVLQQYNSGLVDFQNVLDTQRSLLTFQDQVAASEGAVISHLIRLYKALGGGWELMPPVKEEAALDKDANRVLP